MTLKEKIMTINIPPVEKLPSGENETIDDFFELFIKNRLPEKEIIKKWHKLLMDYVSDLTNLSCCVRYGNDGGKKLTKHGEKGYFKLRRGWLTKNIEDNFEYFYADNFFSSFIYKMAIDKFVPTLEELSNAFKTHKFPYGFGFMIDEKVNEYKGVVVDTAVQPGFLGNYKLSHVFDSGDFFDIKGKLYSDKQLSELYFDIGHSNDFLKNDDKIRRMIIPDEAKKVIVAKFLRFAHPFNYFLTPVKKHHTCSIKVNKNDIGEDLLIINYVKQYLQKEYPKEYQEFLSKIMWYDHPDNSIIVTGKEYIGIKYGLDIGDSHSLKEKYTEEQKLSIAEYYLNHDKGMIYIEENILGLFNKDGWIVMDILHTLGIKGNKKGILLKHSIDEEILMSEGLYKETLLKIKK